MDFWVFNFSLLAECTIVSFLKRSAISIYFAYASSSAFVPCVFLDSFFPVRFEFMLHQEMCVCVCACAPHERNKRRAHQNESEVFVVWNKVRKM